jgi:hypothetical protein
MGRILKRDFNVKVQLSQWLSGKTRYVSPSEKSPVIL